MSELKEIFFDLETKRWSTEVEGGFSNISAFGMSVAVTKDEANGFRTWLENDATDLVTELVRGGVGMPLELWFIVQIDNITPDSIDIESRKVVTN